MFDIQEHLKQLPAEPGVYLMKDKFDNIIYVGKAKILKNRVRQYFQSSKNHSSKVKSMVKNIDKFEYIISIFLLFFVANLNLNRLGRSDNNPHCYIF